MANDANSEQTTHQAILARELKAACRELRRPPGGLLWSSFAAGLEIGFSVLAVAIIVTFQPYLSVPAYELLRAAAYSVGFVIVIFGRSELFTEHTTLAMLPVLAGQGSVRQLMRLWGFVLVANVAGTAAFAAILANVGVALDSTPEWALQRPAAELLRHGPWVMFGSAVLAGWMMGLVSWLNSAGTDTTSRILFTAVITGLIGLAHLHHSIVGSVEVLAACFTGARVGILDYGRFMSVAVLGNALGGSVFVAVVKFAHARPGSAGSD